MVLIPTFQFIVTSGGHVGNAVCFCGRRSSKFPNIELFSPPPCKRPTFDLYCSVIEFVIFLGLEEHLSPVEFPGDSI